MKTRVTETDISRLEYWHAQWEREHENLITHPSFMITKENQQFAELLCREPRFEDALIMLEMYGFCEHMILILSWYKKKFVNRFTEDDLLGEYLLPINAHNKRYLGMRRRLVYESWLVLTDNGSQANDVARALIEFDDHSDRYYMNHEVPSGLRENVRAIRKNVTGQWKDRKCKCKTRVRI